MALLQNELAVHNHGATAVENAGDTLAPAGNLWSADGANRANLYGVGTPAAAMGANALSPVGGGQPHNNVQPYIAINYCIALQGIFPPRS